MPFAVTHIILTIVIVDLFRDYYIKEHKRYFTLHTIFIAGIGGLLPDIDIPLNWLLRVMGWNADILNHGMITHTALFGLVFLISGYILWKKSKHKIATYFFVITFGVMFHLILDYMLGGGAWEGVMWLWPLSKEASQFHLFSYFGLKDIPAAIDAMILLIWLWHEEKRHKISDFI